MRLRKCNICTYKNFGSKIHLKAQYIGILIIFCSQYDITGLERIINRIYMHKFFFLYYLQVLDCHYNIDSIHIDLKVCYCFKILASHNTISKLFSSENDLLSLGIIHTN